MGSGIRGVKPKDLAKVYDLASELGCIISITRATHVKVELPGGGSICGPLTASSSGKSVHSLRTRLRRKGLAI